MGNRRIEQSSEKDRLSQKRQSAWSRYIDARERVDAAYAEMKAAQEAFEKVDDIVRREKKNKARVIAQSKQVWHDYNAFLDYHRDIMKKLQKKSFDEYSKMKECFAQADAEYEKGNRTKAASRSKDASRHKNHYVKLKARIRELVMTIQAERDRIDLVTPKYDSLLFDKVSVDAEELEKKYNDLKAKYEKLRGECEDLWTEYCLALEE